MLLFRVSLSPNTKLYKFYLERTFETKIQKDVISDYGSKWQVSVCIIANLYTSIKQNLLKIKLNRVLVLIN